MKRLSPKILIDHLLKDIKYLAKTKKNLDQKFQKIKYIKVYQIYHRRFIFQMQRKVNESETDKQENYFMKYFGKYFF